MKIVFLDNSHVVLSTLKMLMKNFLDEFETHFCHDPSSFMKMIDDEKFEFDILFCEVIFNSFSINELFTKLRSSHRYPSLKIAVITKEYDQHKLLYLNEFGIKDIFIKSIESDHIENFLKDMIIEKKRF
jgi:PleD family two-component response regulator